jgi:NTE family protein
MPPLSAAGLVFTGLSRRAFFESSSLCAVGLAAAAVVTGNPGSAAPAKYNADAMAAQISEKLFADDGLARPAPDKPVVSDLARGLDRTLVLGGGR